MTEKKKKVKILNPEERDKVATCIKERGNWGKLQPEYRFDHRNFDPNAFRLKQSVASPKLDALLRNIQDLDADDMKHHGKHFKHFIYSDLKSHYGAKLIAAGLQSAGFEHVYDLQKGSRGMTFALKPSVLNSPKDNGFATLTSVALFEKPIGVNFRKTLLQEFNHRPGNNFGQRIRIIILDSGFREGVDLFDIKYVHLFEPISTRSDERQAIGRSTRFCGQKGLQFHREKGWPIYVHRYETILTPVVQRHLVAHQPALAPLQPDDTFFNVFMKYSNIDPKKITFANELEPIAIQSAVDRELTQSIHEFARIQSGGAEQTESDRSTSHSPLHTVTPVHAKIPTTGLEPLRAWIHKHYANQPYIWPKITVENGCMDKGGNKVTFTPTQQFIRTYFTPRYPNPGMLLYHSVGTGKTCTAIATASTTFEREGYTILYVTRYTLKGDVWKNMFGQTCSAVLMDKLDNGIDIPENAAARRRMISKKWFDPISYRQLSNMLSGNNQLANELVQLNGKKDPLHKTLIIIDEAHKLFASDVTGQEKADIDVIRKALLHSNTVSKENGAKILLMTATPYTDDPMDMIRLLNLCRPAQAQLPETFDDFAARYLDESGKFTDVAVKRFQDEIAGYISYLNREKDIRSFAYAVVKDIQVPMSEYEYKHQMEGFADLQQKTFAMNEAYQKDYGYVNQRVSEFKILRMHALKKRFAAHEQKHKKCLEENKEKRAEYKKQIQTEYKVDKEQCQEKLKALKETIKEDYQQRIKERKEDAKEEMKGMPKAEKASLQKELKKEIAQLKMDQKYDETECSQHPSILKCLSAADETKEKKLERDRVARLFPTDECDAIKKDIQEQKEHQQKIIEEDTKKHKEKLMARLEIFKQRRDALQAQFDVAEKELKDTIAADVSQQTGLEYCLRAEVKPSYISRMKGETVFDPTEVDSQTMDELDKKGVTKNIYLISGHGGEHIVNFKSRVEMPADKVLVVFPTCGRYNYMDKGCLCMRIFNDPAYEKWLRNPIHYHRELSALFKQPLRVYLPGDRLPNMTCNLFLDFLTDTNIVIAKSGVFRMQRLPEMRVHKRIEGEVDGLYNPGRRGDDLGSAECIPYVGTIAGSLNYSAKVQHEVFRGNVYKPAESGKSYSNNKNRSFPLTDIMESVGKGIYYYIGCRYSENFPANYDEIFDRSESQQHQKDRSPKIHPLLKELDFDSGEASYPLTPKSRSPKTSPPTNDPKGKRKRGIVVSNAHKELMERISEEIDDGLDQLHHVKESTVRKLLEKWRTTLSTLTAPAAVALRKRVDMFEAFFEHREDATDEIIKEKVIVRDKPMIKWWIASMFVWNKKKYYAHPRLYGYMLDKYRDDETKCSSDQLAKDIVRLYKKNVIVPLPKQPDISPSSFRTTCQFIRDS